jgi:hypothetical protein
MALAVNLTTAGNLQQVTINPTAAKGSAVTDSALVLGNVVYVVTATGHVALNTGATEAIGGAIVGIADGTYAPAATASYFMDGSIISGLTGLTQGDQYWAKEDGTLDLFTNVGAGKWTRLMAVATSATSVTVQMGDIIQHP